MLIFQCMSNGCRVFDDDLIWQSSHVHGVSIFERRGCSVLMVGNDRNWPLKCLPCMMAMAASPLIELPTNRWSSWRCIDAEGQTCDDNRIITFMRHAQHIRAARSKS